MTCVPILDFHIGLPGVAVRYLRSVKSSEHTGRLISNEDFKTFLRSPINARRETPPLSIDVQEFCQSQSKHSNVAASQHALLGSGIELIKDAGQFLKARQRTRNLVKLFPEMNVNLHLTLIPQADFCAKLSENIYLEEMTSISTLSWASLARAIQDECGDARLFVWDFEDAKKMVLPFTCSMLDTLPEEMTLETREQLYLTSEKEMNCAPAAAVMNDIIEHLDDLYERDIAEICSDEHITLINSRTIETEFS